LLTGMAPHSNGLIGLTHRGFQLNDHTQHLVQFLNRHGYETVLSGIQHETTEVEKLGYLLHLNKQNHTSSHEERDIRAASLVADYLHNRASNKQQQPFFISCGLFNTHRTKYDFPKTKYKVNPNYVQPPYPFYDNQQNRQDMADYMASLGMVDECVGLVLDALEASGEADNTLFIFTTDHGLAFPRMKCNLQDTGIGISLIMKVPGNKRSEEACDGLISHVDIFPTICDLIGVSPPGWLRPIPRPEGTKINRLESLSPGEQLFE